MEYQSARNLEELAAFVAVVSANGFTAAAQVSGARKATLSQRVKELESRLKVSLLVRTTRSLRLTEEGRAYFEHARRSVEAAHDADAVIARARDKPSGLLRVTSSAALASMIFEGVIAEYLERYSEVSLELDTSSRIVDLGREGFDLAIRAGVLPDSSLLARRLGTSSAGYYASPRYLARHGTPKHPGELTKYATISSSKHQGPQEWRFMAGNKKRSVTLKPRVLVDSCELAIRAAVAGLGITHAPSHSTEASLASGELVPLFQDWTPPGIEVNVVFAPGTAAVPKARVFIDMLAAWFAQHGEI